LIVSSEKGGGGAAKITEEVPDSKETASTVAISAAFLQADVLAPSTPTQSGRVTIPIPDGEDLDWDQISETEEIEVEAGGRKHYFSVKYSPSNFCITDPPKAGEAPENIQIVCSFTTKKINKIDGFYFIPLCVEVTDTKKTIEIVPCKFEYESLRQEKMEELVYKKAPEKGPRVLNIHVPVNFGGRDCYLKWDVLVGLTHSVPGKGISHTGVEANNTPLDVYSTDGKPLTNLGRFFVIGARRHSLKILPRD
jgi:bifunctional DNA-binding transcriptional regulator/antitoxin component of YhaV-PrlF toxin-antitoxin module